MFCQTSNEIQIDCPAEPIFTQFCVNTGEFVFSAPNSVPAYSYPIYQCAIPVIMPPAVQLPLVRTGGLGTSIFNYILPSILIILFFVVIFNLIKRS